MNTSENQKTNDMLALAPGESLKEWQKTKKIIISRGTFYTGPFATARGNPNFGYVPLILKYIFLCYAIYYVVVIKKYKYAIIALLCYMIGAILNAIRFYYINALSNKGEDFAFIKSAVTDNLIGVFVSFVAILYILFRPKK